jgi:DNA-binding response OmpR family regulator
MRISKKVLIAEDELLIAKVMRLQFEKLGFQVENVPDAEEAFIRTKTMQPDVIILDVYLKNNSMGTDAGRRIREAGINTPIIFTTGNAYDTTRELVKEISGSMVLTKPVAFEQLLFLIDQF